MGITNLYFETDWTGCTHRVERVDCLDYLRTYDDRPFDLTFFDPPFNQNKDYRCHDDNMTDRAYWSWIKKICHLIYERSSEGAAIYFMQREKNAHNVMLALEWAGWTFQNLIIWKKKTSPAHMKFRHGKAYQVIAFYTKGGRPRVFNKLRIDPPLLVTEKYHRKNGVYVTDIWDDIRELTAGFYAGKEPLRTESGERVHKQQSPVHLLARIILTSSNPDDLVLDPFSGTGTTTIVARQTSRCSVSVELDQVNFDCIVRRLYDRRESDEIDKLREHYKLTANLEGIWPQRDSFFMFTRDMALHDGNL